MHKSRLAALVIDCRTDDLDREAVCWSAALGYEVRPGSEPGDELYRDLTTPADQPRVLQQQVDHPTGSTCRLLSGNQSHGAWVGLTPR